jgi:hypothetical protein
MNIVKLPFFALLATVADLNRFAQLSGILVLGQGFSAERIRPPAMAGVD